MLNFLKPKIWCSSGSIPNTCNKAERDSCLPSWEVVSSWQGKPWVWESALIPTQRLGLVPLIDALSVAPTQALLQSWLLHSFNRYLLSTYYTQGTVGSIEFSVVSKANAVPTPVELKS